MLMTSLTEETDHWNIIYSEAFCTIITKMPQLPPHVLHIFVAKTLQLLLKVAGGGCVPTPWWRTDN